MMSRLIARLVLYRLAKEFRDVWHLLREARISGLSMVPYWVEWASDYHRLRWLVANRLSGPVSNQDDQSGTDGLPDA